jgi:hypothetical protein
MKEQIMMPKIPREFTAKELEVMELELGERAFKDWILEGHLANLGDVERYISRWKSADNIAFLWRAKKQDPQRFNQAIGDVRHAHRVRAYLGATSRR